MSWKDKIKNPFRRNKTDNQLVEKQINKESNMGEFQNKNRLNYDDTKEALLKIKGKKKDFSPLKKSLNELLTNLKEFSKEDKNFELNSTEFLSLKKTIHHSHNKDVKRIIELMEKEKEPTELELLSQQINNLTNKFDNFEKENLQSQEDIAQIAQSQKKIDAISKVINNSFFDTLKKSISNLKPDFSSITQKIDSIKNDLKQNKNDINNSNRELAKKIDNIKFPTPPKIPNDILKKDDFEFTINDKLKDLKEIKESSENLETVPAKVNLIEKELKNLSEKMDNLPFSNGSQSAKHIPKEEKSVIELARYMTDGVAQFENIAKEYISKISELDKLDKIKKNHQNELEQAKRDEFKNGEKAGKIELIKTLAENFPREFKNIQSTFEDLLEEKFKKDEILEINDDNLNEMLLFIKDKIENGKYTVLSPAILIDGKILFKANIEAKEDNKMIDSSEKAD
jgi:hypothetical protein